MLKLVTFLESKHFKYILINIWQNRFKKMQDNRTFKIESGSLKLETNSYPF